MKDGTRVGPWRTRNLAVAAPTVSRSDAMTMSNHTHQPDSKSRLSMIMSRSLILTSILQPQCHLPGNRRKGRKGERSREE